LTGVLRYLPAILVAVAILLAPVLWHFSASRFGPKEDITGIAVDSGARIELEMMRGQVEDLEARMATLEQRLEQAREVGPATYGVQPAAPGPDEPAAPNTIIDAYAQLVLIAERRSLNKGLSVVTPAFLENLLGRPRDTVGDECQDMTNPTLRDLLALEEVGPIKVRMLRPAVESLRTVFENVRAADQDLYDRINTSGSLCVRRIRGSANSLSSHAFGLALDLNIDGHLDDLADGKTQLGLTILADFFQAEGWIWGAAFSREDSMHFEVSQELLQRWRDGGLI
jgi:hypothetical protein